MIKNDKRRSFKSCLIRNDNQILKGFLQSYNVANNIYYPTQNVNRKSGYFSIHSKPNLVCPKHTKLPGGYIRLKNRPFYFFIFLRLISLLYIYTDLPPEFYQNLLNSTSANVHKETKKLEASLTT